MKRVEAVIDKRGFGLFMHMAERNALVNAGFKPGDRVVVLEAGQASDAVADLCAVVREAGRVEAAEAIAAWMASPAGDSTRGSIQRNEWRAFLPKPGDR